MDKPVLISGIQPTGRLHLGNYLGALKNFVELQNSEKYQCYFFVADYHSLTESFNPAEKKQQIINLLADFLAAGLNPRKSTIFVQSHIPAHAELAWILNTITPFGELSRMTQFKDKSANQSENINVGLFAYPTLMAADVLLYNAQFVPVGEDQLQHLELTRTLARKFNSRFGDVFIEPQPLLAKIPRLMSLSDPSKKMSKSQPEGCLFLDDSPEDIEKKIMSAPTDSSNEIKYDPDNKPGISNLIAIHQALTDKPHPDKNYASFKKSLAKLIAAKLAPYRRKKTKLLDNGDKLVKIAQLGGKSARKTASEKMSNVKNKIGLLGLL